MSSLSQSLDAINSHSNSIKSLYFTPPGIFTNSLITKPDITTLLRDADNYENTLYHIDTQGNAERVDGTRGVADQLNDEFAQLEIKQQQQQFINESSDPQQQDQYNYDRPSVVLVPKKIDSAIENNEENKGVKNLLKKFNEINQGDYDVDVLCETIRQLLEKYPIDGVNEELLQYINSWESLNTQIMKNEDVIERQRHQLSILNISLNDREMGKHNNQSQMKRTKKASDLIKEREEEIRKLEEELAQRE